MERNKTGVRKMNDFFKGVFNTLNDQAKKYMPDKQSIVNIDAVKLEPEKQAVMDRMMENTLQPSHIHKWQRGVLPGQHYIKQCDCGVMKDVTLAEWTNL